MGGFFAFVIRLAEHRRVARRSKIHVDGFPQPVCIGFGGQPFNGHVRVEVGIAKMQCAVRVGPAHGFRKQMQIQRRIMANFLQVVAFQDIEHLDQRNTS